MILKWTYNSRQDLEDLYRYNYNKHNLPLEEAIKLICVEDVGLVAWDLFISKISDPEVTDYIYHLNEYCTWDSKRGCLLYAGSYYRGLKNVARIIYNGDSGDWKTEYHLR